MALQEEPELLDPEIDTVFENELNFDSLVDSVSWQSPGEYYQGMPAATRAIVESTVRSNEQLRRELREDYFPRLLHSGTLKCWSKADPRYVEAIQRKRLYTGQVVAADGTLA